MSDVPPIAPPLPAGPAGFDPAQYRPVRVPGVEILDRGAAAGATRFVLVHPDTDATLVLAPEDLAVWELFDSQRNVGAVCGEFLLRYRTLALTRVYSLLHRLWLLGFLREDPRLPGPTAAATPRLSLVHWLQLPVPGTAGAARALGAVLHPLRPAAWSGVALAVVVVLCGVVAVTQLGEMTRHPLGQWLSLGPALAGLAERAAEQGSPRLAAAATKAAAAAQDLAASYGLGVLLLIVLNTLVAFLREQWRAGVAAALGGQVRPVRLVFNYGLPSFDHSPTARMGLARWPRAVAGLSGIACELMLGGVAAALLVLCAPVGLAAELLDKLMWVAYARAFLHCAPLAASDWPTVLAERGDQADFRRRAIGFLRRSFIPAALGDMRLGPEQRLFLAANLTAILWLGVAAKFLLQVLSDNQQVIRDLGFLLGGAPLLPSLVLLALLLPVALCALVAAVGCLVPVAAWLRQQSLHENLVSGVGLGVLGMLVVLFVGYTGPYLGLVEAGAVMEALIYALTLVVVVGGLARAGRFLAVDHRSALGIKVLLLTGCLLAGALLLVLPRLPTPLPEVLRVVAGVAVGLVALYHLWLLRHRLHLTAWLGTRFLLTELLLNIGTLIVLVAALASLWTEHAARAPTPVLPLFLGLSALVLGLFSFAAWLQRPLPPVTAILPPPPTEQTGDELRPVSAFIFAQLGLLLRAQLGDTATHAVERRVRRASGVADFAFDRGPGPAGMTPVAYGRQVRDLLVHVDHVITRQFGVALGDRLWDAVLRRLPFRARRLLHHYIYPGSRWAELFAREVLLTEPERRRLLEAISIFRELREDEQTELVNHMVLQYQVAGTQIIRQGDLGDACYFLVQGSVQVETEDSTGDRRILAVLRPGHFFGEAALLAGGQRTASVRAATDCSLLVLPREDFTRVASQRPELAERIREQVRTLQALVRIPIFSDLPSSLIHYVLPRVHLRTCIEGELVVRKGEIGREFFLIKAGTAEVVAQADGRTESVCELGPGDYFGEIALLQDCPRTATVRCLSSCELLVIDKSDFLDLVANNELFAANLRAVSDVRLRRHAPAA